MTRDHYAHLRENLVTYRAMHATRLEIDWCRSCEEHHADASGLCPLCAPADHLAA